MPCQRPQSVTQNSNSRTMKSKYFSTRYQASQIRGTREKSAPRKTNWDRIVYMTFLIGVLIFVGYYLTQRIVYISGDGTVVIEKVVIRSPGDIRDRKSTRLNSSHVA